MKLIWPNIPTTYASPVVVLVGFTLVTSLVLGGGTRTGFLSDALLQLLALPLIAALVIRAFDRTAPRASFAQVIPCAALLTVPLLQLVPLPPHAWSALPGRELAAGALAQVGEAGTWLPISLASRQTWLALLSLTPAIAIFWAVCSLGRQARRGLCLLVLAVGGVSVLLGLMQVAHGPASPLRFYRVTNHDDAVGFFANRNHFAALIVVLTVLAGAWLAHAWTRLPQRVSLKGLTRTSAFVPLVAATAGLLALVIAQVIARSRAGLALSVLALLGVGVLVLMTSHRVRVPRMGRWLAGAAVVVVLIAGQWALQRAVDRFAFDPARDGRIPFARNTLAAALDHLPFGSGIGSFVPVYAAQEPRQDAMVDSYANHAHNDWLQLLLEAGLLGMLVAAGLIAWIAWHAAPLWWRPDPDQPPLDLALARAASLAVLLVALHSFVDYPARTGAMLALLAFLTALLVPAPYESEQERVVPTEVPTSRRKRRRRSSPVPAATTSVASEPAASNRAEPRQWPSEWSSRAGATAHAEASRKEPRWK